MIKLYLPDFYYLYKLNYALIQMLRENPEYFKYKDIQIGAVYGCFPNQIWNGGRKFKGPEAGVSNIIDTINGFNEIGIPIRFTYTNCALTEEHLEDKQCNFITECANNGMNEILVNSPMLEEYLRKKFPNFNYISSTTKCIRDINKINDLINSGKYSLVLGDHRDNYNFDFLDKIEQKDKFEILLDSFCSMQCMKSEAHYKIVSQIQLGIIDSDPTFCPFTIRHWYEVLRDGDAIKTEDLQKYIDMGFFNFKLEGRNFHYVDVVESYVYYLVKPEYQEIVRTILLKSVK